ncbi:RND family efflux transporter, MFP subunit [Synechococcus sp. PCC 7502]|uniref:efflux RND transporter periplasmic adaptor subunit n=1 Tax=Synechococcus sp. PCC 7502 TaxID=1173263 RepID=UPI00029FAE2F|nr:efflux RND transporter periplasmic adaptor subunit [Synechococcus sp. PCC 7502]AFY73644.1 RND family efflux transporter, MFP subunit [Synechococcus sp. PCC 7502]
MQISKPNSWLLPVIVTGLVTVGAIATFSLTQTQKTQNITDLTVPVTSKSLNLKIRASGIVQPIQTVNLSPKVAGQLAQLYVEQGDRISKGQIIAKMDDRSIQTQIAQAQASFANAQANLNKLQSGSRREDIAAAQARLESARARANLSRTRLVRNQDLANQGVITRDRLDELFADQKATTANLIELQRQLELLQNGSRPEDIAQALAQAQEAKARLDAALVQLDDTIIKSPFDGIITQKFSNVGAFVTPTTSASAVGSGSSTSIVSAASGLEILAKVPEVDIAQIKIGQKVEIIADAYPDQTFMGEVRLIAPEAVIEQNVTSFQVRVKLNTGLSQLKSGMNANLIFLGSRINNALLVPTVAIATEKGQTGVYTPDQNQKPRFQAVTIGITIDNQTQILTGVTSGNLVFIKLPDNQLPKTN